MERIEKKEAVDSGVVCPYCYRPVKGAAVSDAATDRYGRVTRRYFGWCCECGTAAEVVQFKSHEKWFIHKYQGYAQAGTSTAYIPAGDCVQVLAMPEPAAVVTGPGGEYDESRVPKISELLEKVRKIMLTTAQTVESIRQSLNGSER